MVQIDFGKEFARREGHIHGNLSKEPQCGHTSIGIKKKVSFFLSPTPFQNGLIQVKCMHLHCFSVKLSSAKELSLSLEKQNLCLFLMYQLNTTHTRCSYHHV